MNYRRLKLITKPFWMPAVAAVYLIIDSTPEVLVLCALFFGMAGDILLMKNKKSWFTWGLIAFLVGHIFYIVLFLTGSGGFSAIMTNPLRAGLLFTPYLGYGVILYCYFRGNVASVLSTVVLYLSVILFMSYAALMRSGYYEGPAFTLPFAGSLLFILSDSLIGIRKFRKSFRGMDLIIIATYLSAQLLIISGIALS